MPALTSVKDADKLILKNLSLFATKKIPLLESQGLILQENIVADRDLPPFNKSLVDGIAISWNQWSSGQSRFKIEGIQAAGQPSKRLNDKKNCIEIMTGAVVPDGCSVVVPVENLKFLSKNECQILLKKNELKPWANIRRKGLDKRKGEILIPKNTELNSARINIIASVGKSSILCPNPPQVAIISTGDELVDLDKPIKSYQTRISNAYAVKAALNKHSFSESKLFHFKDNKISLKRELRNVLKEFDVIILSGGVSMGKFDFVPEVLKSLGVKVVFHKVAQRPGKPFWFGRKSNKLVFALPGNPVSTLICTYRYVIPCLNRCLGIKEESLKVKLNQHFDSKSHLTLFVPVKLVKNNSSELGVEIKTISGSGDFAGLAQSDGFIEIPSGPIKITKGNLVKFFRW